MEGDTRMPCSHPGTRQNETASILPRVEEGDAVQGGGGGTGTAEGWLWEQGAQAGGGVGCQAAARSYWELFRVTGRY